MAVLFSEAQRKSPCTKVVGCFPVVKSVKRVDEPRLEGGPPGTLPRTFATAKVRGFLRCCATWWHDVAQDGVAMLRKMGYDVAQDGGVMLRNMVARCCAGCGCDVAQHVGWLLRNMRGGCCARCGGDVAQHAGWLLRNFRAFRRRKKSGRNTSVSRPDGCFVGMPYSATSVKRWKAVTLRSASACLRYSATVGVPSMRAISWFTSVKSL